MKKNNKWNFQQFLGAFSLRARFLFAPVITVILSIILYLSSHYALQSNADVFKKISESNLVHISEISQITLMLTQSNSDIVALLFESEDLDEETLYIEGKNLLTFLFHIEDKLEESMQNADEIFIKGDNVFSQIKSAFAVYKSQVVLAIEMSSVNVKDASNELMLANIKLKQLTGLFLSLSNYYNEELQRKSQLVEWTLYDKSYLTEVTLILMLLMLFSAYYFSKNTTLALSRVYKALISLSHGNTHIKIRQHNDEYITKVWQAVSEFRDSIIHRKNYQNDIETQKFAMDQHSIITTTDLDGTITSVNEKFCQISGYSKDELMGSNHRILNSGKKPKSYWRDMYEVVSNGGVWQDEVLNRAKDGHLYWVQTTIVPMKSDAGVVSGYMAIRTDITDKKEQYQKLIESNIVAESAVVAKSQFLASMSHEIRTPMNGVLGMLDLILNNELDNKQREHAEIAYTSAKSLLTLINDILDFSKIDANKLELESIHFDLFSMLKELVDCMRFQAEEKNLTLALKASDISKYTVVGDPSRLRQILTNIVGNAIKFTSNGDISIEAKLAIDDKGKANFTCAISDTGIGIPEDKMTSLFNSFSQVDLSTTRKYGGSGLGLAISKRLSQLMGGDINVTSELNKGSCFTVSLPFNLPEQGSETSLAAKVNTDDNLSKVPKWPDTTKILLVEDNRINQRVAQGILKRFGLTCYIANNGKEALIKLQESTVSYSLILMDCQMPEMDGYEATQIIRAHAQQLFEKNIPIIAMTANAMKGDREKCLGVGMSDYLSKPIDPELLLEKLTHWLCS